MGKRIAGDKGTPQIIKYKELEVKTNSVIMLMIISVAVALSPLYFLHFKPIQPIQLSKKPSLEIMGMVRDSSNKIISEEAIVKFAKTNNEGVIIPLFETKVDYNGTFSYRLPEEEKESNASVIIEKSGYQVQSLTIGPSRVMIPILLSEKKG
jgi:hypothetical protein